MRRILRSAAAFTGLTLAATLLAAAPAAHAADAPTLVTGSGEVDPEIDPILTVPSPNGQRLYVAGTRLRNGAGVLAWIDPTGPRETRELTIGGRPTGLAISPDGKRLAASSASDTFVRIVNTATGKVMKQVPVGGRPGALAIGPKGRSLFASVNNGDSVVKIDLTSLKVTGRYPVRYRGVNCYGRGPVGLAVTADSSTVLVTCPAGGLFAMKTSNGKVLGLIDQADGGTAISSPDGTHAYWGSRNELWGLEIPKYPLVFTKDLLVDADGDGADILSRGMSPVVIAMTPDGAKLYATMPDVGAVSHIDPVNLKTPTTRIAVNGSTNFGAQGLAVDASGQRLFITTADGRLITVDTATDTVIGIDALPFAAQGAKANTKILGPVPLAGSRLGFAWNRYNGPGGTSIGSGITILAQ